MDPFKVLGVDYNATEDEIKKAYRALSRKYHPDANVGKPNQSEYEERFKEVQQAYSMIMDSKQGRTVSGYTDREYQGGDNPFNQGDFAEFWNEFFGGFNGGATYRNQTRTEDQYLVSAVNYIRNGYFREGLNVLNQIPEERRMGEWFYYSAFANYRVGNNSIALEHAKAACALEPNNISYRRLLAQLTGGETRYQQRSTNYGGNPTMMQRDCCSNICSTFLCASLCLGGRGAFCCL